MNAIDLLLNGAAMVGEYLPRVRHFAALTEQVATEIPYVSEGHPAHRLDVYRPRGVSGTLPLLLYIHGGGFRILSKDTHRHIVRRFAAAGYVVVNINYRLVPEGRFPGALEDVAAALRWALEHGEEYGADVRRITVAGDSAGANLSLALTLCCAWRFDLPWAQQIFELGVVPAAVLPACGIFEVHDPTRYEDRAGIPQWVRQRITTVCTGYLGYGDGGLLASPLRFLEGASAPARPLPPLFSLCGAADPIVEDSERLQVAMARLAWPGEVRFYEGGGHAFHAFPSELGERAWDDQLEFLKRVREADLRG